MATNINMQTFDNCVVVYLANGTTQVVDPHSEAFIQLADMGFVTLSEAADPDASEHPPKYPPLGFVEAMIAFWTKLAEEIEADMDDDDDDEDNPQVNPL